MNETQFVPDWARGIVWYQIFPERFRNGDPNNDPTAASLKGSWPHDHTSPWQVHPWTSDWYQLQPYERLNGHDIWFNIQRRRYGGDLQGIIDSLDYLVDLGIEAIYLNPVFDAPSLHKYDGASYHHIDPHFGPDPEGDRRLIASETPHDPATWVWTAADRLALRLIAEVHRRGLRIIFDGVWNHMGINSFAFRDVVARQRNSQYRDWFRIDSWDDPAAGTTFAYTGWSGARELPEMLQDANGHAAGPRDYIFAATRRWMDPDGDGDPADGIDGWRLDVAFCVRHPFWKAWRQHVRAINPEAYMVAEVVQSPEEEKPYLEGDEFDAVMNYNFFI
ncbi:MAG: alpha-amylase, partial [Anaerolineae bacterium]